MRMLQYIKTAIRAAGREYMLDRYRRVSSVSNKVVLSPEDCVSKIAGHYLISTEKGVFLIRDGNLLRLFPYRTYGIALYGDVLYLSSVRAEHNFLFRTELPVPLQIIEPGMRLPFQEVMTLTAPINERIHQICVHGDFLVVSKTSANAISFVDLGSDSEVKVIQPFVDSFGMPVSGDHNHVNSVFSCGEVLLWGAYRAGRGSMVGTYQDGNIVGYHAGNKGLHGVYISGHDLYYGDTFGSPAEGKGYLMLNNRRFDASYFGTGDGYCVRGVAQTGHELLIGHSHKGPRAKRFSGSAYLLVAKDGQVQARLEMPFAAIYDILRTDGKYFNEPPAVGTWEEVNGLLRSLLGEPIYEHCIECQHDRS